MTQIDPTAVVDAGAELGADVRVGPYCIVAKAVVLGDGCQLHHHVSLAGPMRVGRANEFYPFTCIGHQTQDLKYAGEPTHLEIGDNNRFREFSTVHRGTAPGSTTRVGSHGNFLAYSHIAHDCTVGDHVIFSNNGTLAGHVEVGNHAVIGGLTAVHQFCRIGDHAITGGCSKIVQDVPPFMIADGNPAEVRSINKIGMERRDFPAETIRLIREAYRIIYRSGLNLQQAIETMRTTLEPVPEIELLINFVASSQRGIIR